MDAPPKTWAVETSKDGAGWRSYGKAWKWPKEAVLLHAAPRFVRYRMPGGEAGRLLRFERGDDDTLDVRPRVQRA